MHNVTGTMSTIEYNTKKTEQEVVFKLTLLTARCNQIAAKQNISGQVNLVASNDADNLTEMMRSYNSRMRRSTKARHFMTVSSGNMA